MTWLVRRLLPTLLVSLGCARREGAKTDPPPPIDSGMTEPADAPDALASDPMSCGWLGHRCKGTACKAGVCAVQVIAHVPPTDAGFEGPRGLALDEAFIYWSDSSDGTIKRRALSGGETTTILSGQVNPRSLAIDASSIYWLTEDPAGHGGSVRRAPIAGGAVTTLALIRPSSVAPAIAVDRTHVYWAEPLDIISQDGFKHDSRVMRIAIEGGTSTALSKGLGMLSTLVIDGTDVYFNALYEGGAWGSKERILSVPIRGGVPTLRGETKRVAGIALDSANLYWTSARGEVWTIPKSGGTQRQLVAEPHAHCVMSGALAARDGDLYWTEANADMKGHLMTMPSTGGAAHTLAEGTAMAIAVSAEHVYWTTLPPYALLRVAR